MKYEIRYNTINQMIYNQRGLYTILRIISTDDIPEKDILNDYSNILSQLINIVDTPYCYNISKGNIEVFKNYIDYHKYDFIKKERRLDRRTNKYYYYYQLVFFGDEFERRGIYHNIFYKIGDAIRKISNMKDRYLLLNENIRYSYSIVYSNGDYSPQSFLPENIETRDIFNSVSNCFQDICVNIDLSKAKSYKTSNAIKLDAFIYDNLKDAINNRSSNNWIISAGNELGVLSFGKIQSFADGNYRYMCDYNDKFKAEYIGNKIVIYDGEKTLDLIKDNIREWDCNFVLITQFTKNKKFFNHALRSNKIKKIIIHFINSDRIISGSIDEVYSDMAFSGKVSCRVKNKRQITYEIGKNDGILRGEYIIPYNPNDNICVRALYYVNKIILSDILDTKIMDGYKNTLFSSSCDEDDVLSVWFNYCSGVNRNNDMKIIDAYKKMKNNLINEYKQLSCYIDNYDFSKCSPIPTIRLDDKLKNNFYKTLHIEAKNIIINKINKTVIDPIKSKQVYVKGMFQIKDKQNKTNMLLGEIPLTKFYNSKDNSIELNYIKLKGEIYNDKVKNRR